MEVTVEIVSAQEVSKGLPRLHIKSRNISKGGICLETMSIEVDGVNLLSGPPFVRENRLHISIELILKEPPLMAIGEIRWYDIAHDIPEFIYRLGVAFIEIKDGGKDQLARLRNIRHGFQDTVEIRVFHQGISRLGKGVI